MNERNWSALHIIHIGHHSEVKPAKVLLLAYVNVPLRIWMELQISALHAYNVVDWEEIPFPFSLYQPS